MKNAPLNVLADRYATQPMRVFSEREKNFLEREFWLEVMKVQKSLGVSIPSDDILKYEKSIQDINLARIAELEVSLRHDIKAKIQHWNEVADVKKEHIHKRLTSRDLTDNVEQIQILRAGMTIRDKYVSVLRHMADLAERYADLKIAGRSHHQAAQPTLLGRRFAMWAEIALAQFSAWDSWLENYPMRGIKGPMGTQQDMLSLLGSADAVESLELSLAKKFGFSKVMISPGQVYSRSFDYGLLSNLVQLGSPLSDFATSTRLMAGLELVTEGFKEGQVGSTAMPHKMNTRNSERINGMQLLLKMYANGAAMNSGAQWEEGDVSCSVVRRVIIPDAFYAIDGLIETTLTVLNEYGAYPAIIENELTKYMPFLATTELLGVALDHGIPREVAHEAIKSVSVYEAKQMRAGKKQNDLVSVLSEHPTFISAGVNRDELDSAVRNLGTGLAKPQTYRILKEIRHLTNRMPEAAAYEPEKIR